MTSIDLLKEEYSALRRNMLSQGRFMLKPTEKGFWGISSLEDAEALFGAIGLDKSKRFVDLGSGDGRMVLAAGLFSEATGIECDQELMQISTRMQKKASIPATFVCGDFMKSNLSGYDYIFVHPDKDLKELEAKLAAEMKKDAKLIVYNKVYLPATLKLEKKLDVNGMPVHIFGK